MDTIVKVDNMAEEGKGLAGLIKLPEGLVGGEFTMVPRNPPSKAHEIPEEDGWLIGYVINVNTMESFCLVCSFVLWAYGREIMLYFGVEPVSYTHLTLPTICSV